MEIVCRTFVDSERFFVSLQSKSSGEYYTLGLLHVRVALLRRNLEQSYLEHKCVCT